MVEIADIKDQDSLQAWLETQPQKTSVAIAQRVAMRLLPLYWQWELETAASRSDDLTALPILRRLLISGVAANCPTPDITKDIRAASASASAASAAYAASAASASAAYAYAASAYAASAAASASASAASAAYAYAASAAYAVDMWNILRTDCAEIANEDSLASVKLWPNGENPYAEHWQQIKTTLGKDSIDWSFWVKWVEAALAGVPLEWEMLERIALITPKDWEQGPAHVNAIIAEIEGEFEMAEPEIEVTPVQMLSRNKSVIENQLAVLVQLVTEEIDRIRGQNDFTKAEGELIASRVTVLESILAAVEKIRAALAGEEPSTALAVIEEQLPEVFEGAEKLEALRLEDVLSGSIIAMGVAVKYLTDCGMSSADATKVAMGDMAVKKTKSWFGRKKK